MKKHVPISQIMTENVVTLQTTDDLVRAEELFKKNRIRHIPVVLEGKVIGMLSYSDLMRISFADAITDNGEDIDSMVYNMFTIDQVMAKDVVSVSSDATVKEVASFLAKKEFHALPVVDGETLVGIVTTTDIINYLLAQY